MGPTDSLYCHKKLGKWITNFIKLREWLSKQNIINIYKSLVSQLSHELSVWGAACFSISLSLEIAQNRVLKIILDKTNRFSSELLYTEANVF